MKGVSLRGAILCAVAFFFSAGVCQAAQIYNYAEPGCNGELKLEKNPGGIWLTIETINKRGHTCELDGYECALNGSQYRCEPHEGGDEGEPPIILQINGNTLTVRQANGAKSPDGLGANFCGATGTITGKYTRK